MQVLKQEIKFSYSSKLFICGYNMMECMQVHMSLSTLVDMHVLAVVVVVVDSRIGHMTAVAYMLVELVLNNTVAHRRKDTFERVGTDQVRNRREVGTYLNRASAGKLELEMVGKQLSFVSSLIV